MAFVRLLRGLACVCVDAASQRGGVASAITHMCPFAIKPFLAPYFLRKIAERQWSVHADSKLGPNAKWGVINRESGPSSTEVALDFHRPMFKMYRILPNNY